MSIIIGIVSGFDHVTLAMVVLKIPKTQNVLKP